MAGAMRARLLMVVGLLAAVGAAHASPIVVARSVQKVRFKTVHLGHWVNAAKVPADVVCNANFFWRDAPLGVVVKDGRLLNRGIHHKPPRAAFVVQRINKQQRVRIVEVWERGKQLYCRQGPLKNVQTLVQAGPRLVAGGKATVNRTREGFRYDVARRTRHVGLGITGDGRVLLVVESNVNLWEFARTFVRLGARDAMNLDGGHSVTLAVGRKVRVGSGRILTGLAINAPKPVGHRG